MTQRLFHFVRHGEAMGYLRCGWMPHSSLNGTHHGMWSVLCEWICECEPVFPNHKR